MSIPMSTHICQVHDAVVGAVGPGYLDDDHVCRYQTMFDTMFDGIYDDDMFDYFDDIYDDMFNDMFVFPDMFNGM